MAIKSFNPTTPSLRKMQTLSTHGVTEKCKLPKAFLKKRTRSAGRNNLGRITSRRRGGGAKRKYRVVDFKRNILDIPAKVTSLCYDPGRTSHLAYISYANGAKALILASEGVKVGDTVLSPSKYDPRHIHQGNTLKLKDIPDGREIHNVELYPGAGGILVRSAGSYAQLMSKEGGMVLLRMPSGEMRKINQECRATIGRIGNAEHEKIVLGKAGANRLRGRRPKVRGVAMNPIDHPHGGGEGRTSGGRHPVSPWGTPTKGYKTRRNKVTTKFIVKRRTKKKG